MPASATMVMSPAGAFSPLRYDLMIYFDDIAEERVIAGRSAAMKTPSASKSPLFLAMII